MIQLIFWPAWTWLRPTGLFDVRRKRLEALIHRVFEAVQFNVEIPDRFGKLVHPREWFSCSLDGNRRCCVQDRRR